MNAESIDAELQADLLRLREQQKTPRLTRFCSGHAGVQDNPGTLLEGDRNAQITPYLHLFAAGAGDEELPGGQRPDRLSQDFIGRPGLQEIHDRVDGGQFGDGVGAQEDWPSADQIDDG